jgi:cyclase
VTFVGEPEQFAAHLHDLDRLAALQPVAVLPNHGAPEVIAQGGYGAGILPATQDYIRWLQNLKAAPELAETPLRQVIGPALAARVLRYFAPYEEVHRQNVARSLALWQSDPKV